MPTLAIVLLQMLPSLIKGLADIIKAVQADPGVPADVKGQYAMLAAQLDATATAVAAVEIRRVVA